MEPKLGPWRSEGPGWKSAQITAYGDTCSGCGRQLDVTNRVYIPVPSWNKGYCEECWRAFPAISR